MTKSNVDNLRARVRRVNRQAFRPITTAEFFGVSHVAWKSYVAAGCPVDRTQPEAFIKWIADYYKESRHDPQAA